MEPIGRLNWWAIIDSKKKEISAAIRATAHSEFGSLSSVESLKVVANSFTKRNKKKQMKVTVMLKHSISMQLFS